MIDTESVSFEIADAIGNDFTYLQPPGEQRFDPVSVAVLLGLWMLSAVAEGIREGIKETTTDQTRLLLTAVGGKIRTLLPERVKRAFTARKEGPPTDQEHALVRKELSQARDAANSIEPSLREQLPDAVASAVREVLGTEGLPYSTAQRVERVIRVQVEIVLTTS